MLIDPNSRLDAGLTYNAAQDFLRGRRTFSQAFPGYTDCHLRMACIMRQRGDLPEALRWARQALDHRPGLADARALLGASFHNPPHPAVRLGSKLKQAGSHIAVTTLDSVIFSVSAAF